MKRIISAVLIVFIVMFMFASCSSKPDTTDPNEILSDILESYRTNGMTSWWEILAVYNADENPMDYKGFDEILKSLEGTANSKMASYVTVANIAVVIGSDAGYYEKYEEYKTNLKNLLENPTDEYTLNDYIFGYLALKCSGMNFDENKVWDYFIQVQKSDGGFALSGDSGDVDVTSFAVQALKRLLYERDDTPFRLAINFLAENINENGTYSSSFDKKENSNSTACALSALINWYTKDPILDKASDGLAIFKVKKEPGYSFLNDGGKSNALATSQAAIVLSDLKNSMSVWEKLYLESIDAFTVDE